MSKLDNLIKWFEDKNKVIIALSGGVDSALVAYAAFQQLGDSAVAVTADYKTLSKDELESAKKICSEIGIKQILLDYNELENAKFVQNNSDRCYHCRLELGEHLLELADKLGVKFIVDGTNLDDLGEFRPGIDALRQNGIRSPLVETKFNKKEIRNTAQQLGLSVHDKPSNSCLASRIPWGQRVTSEKLIRIELSETIVKQITNAKQVRVRDIAGIAKIEVEKDSVLQLHNPEIFEKINNSLRLIGFRKIIIDDDGYAPGKINVIAD